MLERFAARPGIDPSAPSRGRRLVDAVAVVAAATPFLVTAVVVLLGPEFVLGGDQALLALDSVHLLHLEQPLGAYSRTGWAHPGPAWLAMLAPFFWLFGSTSAALVAASLVVHGVFAALVVALAGTGRAWQRPLMAAVLLLYVLRMPAAYFVSVWNPFATLLPAVLLLLLAARACGGSLVALAGCLVVGSFLVQTHIGTAPLVLLVLLAAVVVVVLRAVRGHAERPARRDLRRAAAVGAGAVLLWVPPVWQQVTAPEGRGNLGLLLDYFLHGDPEATGGSHSWPAAASAVGQLLGAPVLGWQSTPAAIDTGIADPAVVVLLAAQLLGALAVVLVGRGAADRFGSRLAVLTVVAAAAALIAARTVTGPVYNYLLVWVTVLPAVLLFAGLLVLGDRGDRRGMLADRRALVGLSAVVVALAVACSVSLHGATGERLPDQPGAREVVDLVLEALPDPVESPVLLDIDDVGVWTTATSVALALEQKGHEVVVEEEWVYGFGADREATGDERWRVALRPLADADAPAEPGRVGVVGTAGGPTAVLVEDLG